MSTDITKAMIRMLAIPSMPSWNRVISATPDILDHIYEAVEEDNKG